MASENWRKQLKGQVVQWWSRQLEIQSFNLDKLKADRDYIDEQNEHGFAKVTADRIGVPWSEMAPLGSHLPSWTSDFILGHLMEEVERHRDKVVVEGRDHESPPGFHIFEHDGLKEELLHEGVVFFPKGTLTEFPLVLRVYVDAYGGQHIDSYSAPENRVAAHDLVKDLISRASGPNNPYRGRTVVAGESGRFRIVPHLTDQRSALSLDPAVETAMNNIHTFFDMQEALLKAGLSTNRGLLLYGPPGTGKSAVTRVLGAELAGDVTVILADEKMTARGLPELYKVASELAPALIALDDLDLMTGSRNRTDRGPLKALLSVLNGVMTEHGGVATVASVNDINALDPATIRAGRFDEHVETPFPGVEGRRMMLVPYLERMAEAGFDVSAIDPQTVAREMGEGHSGADMREILTRAAMSGKLTSRSVAETGLEMIRQKAHERESAQEVNFG
jgi:hypothetical protein